MKSWFPLLLTPALLALSPPTANELRSAIGPVVSLAAGSEAALKGRTDDEDVSATIRLDEQGVLAAIQIIQNDRTLTIPDSAWQGLSGARQAWLEERGALTTLVIEGKSDGRDWRLALEFHPRQLWLRRLSRKGEAKESFIFFDRDDLAPQKEQLRRTMSRGFHD